MRYPLPLLAIVVGTTASARANLVINLDFSAFDAGAPSNASSILNNASFTETKALLTAATQYWTTAFAGSASSASFASGGTITQNIAVSWGQLDGATLAQGGTSFNPSTGRFGSASLTIDNDGSSTFYVDTTPGDSAEWTLASNRTASLGGANAINIERIRYSGATSVVRNNADMLSVAIHEIGHTLGYLGGYPLFTNATTSGALAITSGTFAGNSLQITGGHLADTLATPSGLSIGGAYYSENMGPSVITGTRKLLTEADIAGLAEILKFDMNTVNFNPTIVPEPSFYAWGAVLIAAVPAFVRRRSARRA